MTNLAGINMFQKTSAYLHERVRVGAVLCAILQIANELLEGRRSEDELLVDLATV